MKNRVYYIKDVCGATMMAITATDSLKTAVIFDRQDDTQDAITRDYCMTCDFGNVEGLDAEKMHYEYDGMETVTVIDDFDLDDKDYVVCECVKQL